MINNLSGHELMKTDSISTSTKKGKHITSHRELSILSKGALLIDNPGMREVGMSDVNEGLKNTFEIIVKLSEHCKFKNCNHIQEKDCAVLKALEKGKLDQSSYDNYQKMVKEKIHFESNLVEKRKKDKDFGKMIKNFKKHNKNEENMLNT